MNLIIGSEEVLSLAFRPVEKMAVGSVPEAVIESAQRRYLKPVLGKLYDRIVEGEYADFAVEYLRESLAFYVKADLIASGAGMLGSTGMVRMKGDYTSPASSGEAAMARLEAKKTADALLDRAVEFIEADPEGFPEYDPSQNVRRRVRLQGGMVVRKCR